MHKETPSSLPKEGGDLLCIDLFKNLSKVDLDRILPALNPRSLRRGHALSVTDEYCERIGFVWSGRYRLAIVLPPHHMVSVRFLNRGATLGPLATALSAAFGNQLRIICDKGGHLLEIDAALFAAFRREIPALDEAILNMMTAIAVDQGTRRFELLALDTRGRVQAELLRLAQDGEWRSRRCIVLHAPTHRAIADQVGTSPERIARIMRQLASDNLIRTERGIIEILDIDRLLALDEAATGRRMFDSDNIVPANA